MPKIGECSPYDLNCRNKTCTHLNPPVTPEPEYILDIVTDRGIPFRVVYGVRENIHGRPMTESGKVVAFYDRRFLHTRHGQFVSDYRADTLLERPIYGLNLQGNVENWSIDRVNMIVVDEWLDALVNMSR